MEARGFLSGGTPGKDDQEYLHHGAMQVVLISEHATSANADVLPIGRLCPHKPGKSTYLRSTQRILKILLYHLTLKVGVCLLG
jgi:hypothetical protein